MLFCELVQALPRNDMHYWPATISETFSDEKSALGRRGDLRRADLCRSRPRGSIEIRSLPTLTHSLLPSQLYLGHSHCPVLAPATLAALPSTHAIPDRDVFYVAHPVRSIDSRSPDRSAASPYDHLPVRLGPVYPAAVPRTPCCGMERRSRPNASDCTKYR